MINESPPVVRGGMVQNQEMEYHFAEGWSYEQEK